MLKNLMLSQKTKSWNSKTLAKIIDTIGDSTSFVSVCKFLDYWYFVNLSHTCSFLKELTYLLGFCRRLMGAYTASFPKWMESC